MRYLPEKKKKKKENWTVGTQQTMSSASSIDFNNEEGLKYICQNSF